MKPFRIGKKRRAASRGPALTLALTLLLVTFAPPVSAGGLATRRESRAPNSRAQDARRLEPGRPFEREIAAGETHLYKLSLAAAQLVRLAVEPQRAMLVLTLFGPGGEKLYEFELQGDSPVPSPVAFVSETPGGYRIEVRAPEKSPPGRYALGVEELRVAGPHDRSRVEAERAFADGARLQFVQGGATALRAAIAKYERARSLWHASGDRALEARALGGVSAAHVSLGEHREAVGRYLMKLEIVRELKDARQEAFMSEEIGRLYYSPLGDKARALAHLDDALGLYRELGRQESEARALTFIGKVYAELGATPDEQEKSIGYFLKALAIQHTLKNRYYEGDTFGNLMFAWKAMGKPRQAIFFGKKAVNVFQEIRIGIKEMDIDEATRQTFLKSKEEIYRALIALLIEEGRFSEARLVIGMLKEEEYSEFMKRAINEPPPDAKRNMPTPKEIEWERRYAERSEKLTALGREHGDLRKKKDRTPEEELRLKRLADDIELSNTAFNKFLEQLKSDVDDKAYVAHVTSQLRDTKGMRAGLGEIGPGVVALFTIVSKEKYYVILVTRDVQRAFEYKISSTELNKKIFYFREALQDKDSDPLPLAQELYKILVGPVAKDLEAAGAETLMWSFDWVLRYVPVAALHDGERYMVERYRNVIFTPASVMNLKDEPMENWKGMGFGVSKKHGDFPALPGVPEELRGIFKPEAAGASSAAPAPAVPAATSLVAGIIPGRIYLDESFTEDSLKTMLYETYPVVHIASHFWFRSGDESNSFLLLGDGKHLSLGRIDTSLDFTGVELLALSACDTATGGEGTSGTEVESFAVLAQRNSAKAILATLWPVADESTMQLMLDFYRFRNGQPRLTKADALREAQLTLLRGGVGAGGAGGGRGLGLTGAAHKVANAKAPFSHPYFWAPFLLFGNWR